MNDTSNSKEPAPKIDLGQMDAFVKYMQEVLLSEIPPGFPEAETARLLKEIKIFCYMDGTVYVNVEPTLPEELHAIFHRMISRLPRMWGTRLYTNAYYSKVMGIPAQQSAAPRLGERILLLILTKEERINIPGDLEEEYRSIAAKHGARYAKLWYYKQVAASAWPMVRKTVGWGLLASIGAWIRRYI
jgi:hypothetical protein